MLLLSKKTSENKKGQEPQITALLLSNKTKKTRTTDNSSIRTFPANFVKLIIFFSVIPINLMLHTMSSSETTFSIHSASIYYEVQGCDCLVEGVIFEIKENTMMSVDNDPPSPSFTQTSPHCSLRNPSFRQTSPSFPARSPHQVLESRMLASPVFSHTFPPRALGGIS